MGEFVGRMTNFDKGKKAAVGENYNRIKILEEA